MLLQFLTLLNYHDVYIHILVYKLNKMFCFPFQDSFLCEIYTLLYLNAKRIDHLQMNHNNSPSVLLLCANAVRYLLVAPV